MGNFIGEMADLGRGTTGTPHSLILGARGAKGEEEQLHKARSRPQHGVFLPNVTKNQTILSQGQC